MSLALSVKQEEVTYNKKAPTSNGTGPDGSHCGTCCPLYETLARLLGSRSGVSSSRSGIGCSLGSIASSRSSRGSGVSSSSSGFGSDGSRCSCRLSSHWCGSRSRLFLLATGSQGGSSDQGGDDERLVHFRFSLRTVKKTKNATTPSLLQPGSALAESAPAGHVFISADDYIGYSSILNNTEYGLKTPSVANN